jgi:hypothetical protein
VVTTPQQQHVGYHWKFNNRWNKLEAHTSLKKYPIQAGSEEEFITEHFWGYSGCSKTATGEYQVEHPRWDVFPVEQYTVDCNFSGLYGPSFSVLNDRTPDSVFLAEGSAINVYAKRKLIS